MRSRIARQTQSLKKRAQTTPLAQDANGRLACTCGKRDFWLHQTPDALIAQCVACGVLNQIAITTRQPLTGVRRVA